MTPAELGWTQGVVFLFLGTVTSGVVSLCVRNCRTKHGEREVDLESGIQIETDTGTDSFESVPRSELISLLQGGHDEGRSPSNDAPEALVFTALLCRSYERKPCNPSRKRPLSNCRTLKPPSMKKSRDVDVEPQTEPRMLRKRARRNNDVTDPAIPRVSSTTTGLPRPPRRRFVPRSLPQDERILIPQEDHLFIETTQGLRHRPEHVRDLQMFREYEGYRFG